MTELMKKSEIAELEAFLAENRRVLKESKKSTDAANQRFDEAYERLISAL